MKTSAEPLEAQVRLSGPANVIDGGVANKPGLEPVDWAIVKLAVWKEPEATSSTWRIAVWFVAVAAVLTRILALPDASVVTVAVFDTVDPTTKPKSPEETMN